MLDALIQSDVTARLGVVLLHFVWQGFAIGALLAVCLAALGAQANRAKYAAAVGAMILLVVSPTVTWWLVPSNSLPVTEITASVEADRPESNASLTPPEALGRGGDAATQFVPRQEASVQQSLRMSLSRFGGSVVSLSPWLALLWMLGAAASSANLIGGFLTLRRRRLGAALATTDLRHLCTALAKRMGTRVDVELRVSSKIDSPCTFGLFRPVILLPVSVATGLPVTRLEMILAHELAHIRRHDYLVNVLQAVTETLLFYHPVVWWVSAITRREREYVCDSVALEATGARHAEYVETLLSLEETRTSLSLAASEAPLLARVRRILGAPPRSRTPTPLVPVMVLGLLSALTMGLVLAQADPNESERIPSDPIAEVTERFDIPYNHFVWATVVGDVQWRDDYSHLDPDRWTSFDDDAYVLLEERSPAFTRTARIWQDEQGLAYHVRVPRDAQSLDPDEALHWLNHMLDQTYDPEEEGTWGTSSDSTVISVLRGENVADLREQVLDHAGTLSFNPWLASQAMQLHSAELVDDAFLAEVVRTNIATLEDRLPTEAAARGSRIEHHVPWMLLTAYAIESDELRLEVSTQIARFATQPSSSEASELQSIPTYNSAGRIHGWDVAPN